jgi:hypothetical protein
MDVSMKKIFFLSVLTLAVNVASAGCFSSVAQYDVENCKSTKKVGNILNCINNVSVMINSCKQEMEVKKKLLAQRKDQILFNETLKIKDATDKMMVKGVNNKQNARYLALKELNKEFEIYSDNLKGAIAKSNTAYNELLAIDLKAIGSNVRATKVNALGKIAKRITNESKNAQVYFDEFKASFLAKEALLQLNIIDGTLTPVTNLKKQNSIIVSFINEAIDIVNNNTFDSFFASGINFPNSLEALVRESENQEVLLDSCSKNNSKECKKLIQVNESYHAEVEHQIIIAKSQFTRMKNLELKEKALEAEKKNDLIEYGRLFDLARSSGAVE